MLAANPDASYLMAVTESSQTAGFQPQNHTYGVCMLDITTGRIIIGQVLGNSLFSFIGKKFCAILLLVMCSMFAANQSDSIRLLSVGDRFL